MNTHENQTAVSDSAGTGYNGSQHYTDGGVTVAPAQQNNKPKLSLFMKLSIALLALLAIVAIVIIFLDLGANTVDRIVLTGFVFIIFAGLTMLDHRFAHQNSWYLPVALFTNIYAVAITIIVTWVDYYTPAFLLALQIMFTFFIMRILLLLGQAINLGLTLRTQLVPLISFSSALALLLFGVLVTLPFAIEAFEDLEVTDFYTRFVVASAVLATLGVVVSVLLRFALRPKPVDPFPGYPGVTDYRDYVYVKNQEAAAAQAASQAHGVGHGTAYPVSVAPQGSPAPAAAAQAAPAQVASAQPASAPAPAPAPAQAPQVAPAQPVAQAPAAEPERVPWPTLADGTPLPQLPNGLPDFSVPGAPAPPANLPLPPQA